MASAEEKVRQISVELVMAFEESFGIEIPDPDAEKIKTVQDAMDYVRAHAKGEK